MRKSPLKKIIFNFSKLAFSGFILLSTNFLFGQTAPVATPKGGFKIDGHLRANTPAASRAGDWVPQVNGTAFTGGIDSFVLSSAGVPEDAVTTRLESDLFNSNSDNVFTQGSKFNDTLGSLHWGLSGAPDKNDIHRGVFHASADNATPAHQWVFIGGDRLSVSGTSYIDFQFLQGTVAFNGNSFRGSGPHGGRTVGDINISMEYNNGGSAPKVVIYTWTPANEAGTNWQWDSTGSHEITQAYAQTNLVNVEVPFGAFGSNTYQPFAFVEAAIDITQVISLTSGNCAGLSIKTLWITTKASSSSTAALKDFMSPISLNLNFGGVSIDPQGPICVNGGTIALTGSPSGGTFSGSGVTGTTFNPAAVDAGVGSHTVMYTASVGAGCTRTASTVIEVRALPTASISGTTAVCKDATSPFVVIQGAGGTKPYTFSYNIGGGSTLQRTTTGTFDTVRIAVPTGTAGSFVYNLVSVQESSSTTCSQNQTGSATVTVNQLPTASAGTAPAAQCYDVAGNTFALDGTATNGTPVWSVQSKSNNALSVSFSPNTGAIDPSVSVSGSSLGGTVTLLLTVNSNTSPTCGSATSTVTVTVTGQSAAPDVTYIPPTCLETTFKVQVNSPVNGSTYTLRQLAGGVGPLTKTAPGDVVDGKIVFEGLTVGKGYRVTETTSAACISSPAVCGDFSAVTGARMSPQQTANPETETATVKAYPNPFSDKVKFVVTSTAGGDGNLEIFNMMGQRVKTVHKGFIAPGTQTFELTLPTQQVSTLVYVLRIGDKKMTGKVIQINQ